MARKEIGKHVEYGTPIKGIDIVVHKENGQTEVVRGVAIIGAMKMSHTETDENGKEGFASAVSIAGAMDANEMAMLIRETVSGVARILLENQISPFGLMRAAKDGIDLAIKAVIEDENTGLSTEQRGYGSGSSTRRTTR